MVYNKKYDRWVSKDGLVYRYDSKQDKLVLCKQTKSKYLQIGLIKPKNMRITVHRLVWETFNGEIPDGFEIDHINADKLDNRLVNLQCVTHEQNMNNPLTKTQIRNAKMLKPRSKFYELFVTHYGVSSIQNMKLYKKEYAYFKRYGYCSWEK